MFISDNLSFCYKGVLVTRQLLIYGIHSHNISYSHYLSLQPYWANTLSHTLSYSHCFISILSLSLTHLNLTLIFLILSPISHSQSLTYALPSNLSHSHSSSHNLLLTLSPHTQIPPSLCIQFDGRNKEITQPHNKALLISVVMEKTFM